MEKTKVVSQSPSIRIPSTSQPRVVIVGGGFGGLQLAQRLRSADLQVVMFDRYNYHTFQPLLYQVATAGLEPDSIAGPLRKIFETHKNFYFRMAEVTRIRPDDKVVETSIGTLSYDFLVLANGSRTNYFGNKEIAQHAFPLKQLPQALDLRHHILESFEQALLQDQVDEQERLMNFVVVGGGPTGVEVAGALGELKLHVLPQDHPELDFRKMNIYLVEGGNQLLSGMTEKSGKEAEKYLKKFSVQVFKDVRVNAYDGKTAQLSNGKDLETSTLIWAAGVTGNLIEGLKKEAVTDNNRLKVNAYNQVEGYEAIFAIGDAAAMSTEEYPRGHPMVAPVAIQQGKLLSKNILALLQEKPLKAFSYTDKGSMATVGRHRAVVDLPNKWHFGGTLAWWVWLFVHLMSIVGFRNKLSILLNWVWNYFTYDRATRLILRPFVNRYRYFKD